MNLKNYIITVFIVAVASLKAFAVEKCPQLEGSYFYSDQKVGHVTNSISQVSCSKLILKTVRKAADGEVYEIESEFTTDGILRRINLPAPYATYEEAYYDQEKLVIKKFSMHLRRNVMVHSQEVMNVKRQANGRLLLRRELRNDDSEITEVIEREMDPI